jgi:hypothetical protein
VGDLGRLADFKQIGRRSKHDEVIQPSYS